MLHKSIATLLGLANKAEICGPEFGPAKSAQVCRISVSVTALLICIIKKNVIEVGKRNNRCFFDSLRTRRAIPAGPHSEEKESSGIV